MAKHLTLEERDRIAHLRSRGVAQAALAKALGPQTFCHLA